MKLRIIVGLFFVGLLIAIVAVGCAVDSMNDGIDEIDIDHKKPKKTTSAPVRPSQPSRDTVSRPEPSKAVTQAPRPSAKAPSFTKPRQNTGSGSRRR